jgi:excisionase family DNA binding protein
MPSPRGRFLAIAQSELKASCREYEMNDENFSSKKNPGKAGLAPENKLLVGRQEAAALLSISQRALDYLVANKHLQVRRIGTRVLIPRSELHRFVRGDHPERLAG